MTNRLLSISLVAGLVFSCSKKKENEPAETPKNAEAPTDVQPANAPATDDKPAGDVLVVKAAKLSFEKGENNPDGPDGLELDADGNLLVKGQTVLSLGADGKVVDTKGKLVASITADGLLSFVGEEETMTIAEDGSISAGGKTVASIGDDGILAFEELSEKVVYEGPAEGRRAMMIAFVTAMQPSEQHSSTPTVTSDPAAGELTDLKAGDKGCNMTFQGRCFKTDVDACRAAGCELADCSIAETMPGRASCNKK